MAAINSQAVREAKPNEAFEPLPAAWYTAMIVESELCRSGPNAKDPNGQYYKFTFQIADGQYVNRKVWSMYNIVNANPQAVEIAYADLAAIYKAIGAENEDIQDTSQLHNRPLAIKVGITPARGDYDAGNSIKGYRAAGSAGNTAPTAPGVGAPPAPAAPPPPPAAAGAPPAPPAPPVAAAAPPAPPVAAAPPAPPTPPVAETPAAPPVAEAPAVPTPPAPPTPPAMPTDGGAGITPPWDQ